MIICPRYNYISLRCAQLAPTYIPIHTLLLFLQRLVKAAVSLSILHTYALFKKSDKRREPQRAAEERVCMCDRGRATSVSSLSLSREIDTGNFCARSLSLFSPRDIFFVLDVFLAFLFFDGCERCVNDERRVYNWKNGNSEENCHSRFCCIFIC